MRDVSVWREMLGVEKAVIERVEFDEDEELLVARVRPTSASRPLRGVSATQPGLRRGVRVGGVGGRWIWARCGRSLRPTHRGCAAVSTG